MKFVALGLLPLFGGEVSAEAAGTAETGAGETGSAGAGLGPEVVLGQSATFDVEGAGGPMRVVVSWPAGPVPEGGYGAIYAMDAGWTFGILRDVTGMSGLGSGDGGAAPTIVVALGWPTETLVDMDRRGPDLIGPPQEGSGRSATLALLADQVIPKVEALLPVDPSHRMILGHSFGGAFALQAMLERPGLFSHVAAGSPSIWTEPETILSGVAALCQGPHPAIFLTIGALEDADAAEAAGSDPARVKRLRERQMMPRVRALAESCGLSLQVYDGLSHGGAIAPFLSDAAGFLWNKP